MLPSEDLKTRGRTTGVSEENVPQENTRTKKRKLKIVFLRQLILLEILSTVFYIVNSMDSERIEANLVTSQQKSEHKLFFFLEETNIET